MPVAASNPSAQVKMSDDDVILHLLRDRVIDRLVYDSLFTAESANWMVHHLVTPDVVTELRAKMRFPKPQGGSLLDWLEKHSDGVEAMVAHLTAKFLKFAGPKAT